MGELVEIRHNKMLTKKKNGVEYQEPCDRLCVRVFPGSSGKAYCQKCGEYFDFEVLSNNEKLEDVVELLKQKLA